MKTYIAEEICTIIGGEWLNNSAISGLQIEHIVIDSRQILFPAKSLFAALSGQRTDGHQYLGQAYKLGVRNFVVSKAVKVDNYPEANFIRVKDVVLALQELARHHRQQLTLLSIGITGSNGKTIVKEWLAQLLETDYAVAKSPRSYNSQIGVPLSVWQAQTAHQVGLFEAGISKKGEMHRLAPIIDCQIGIFTNIGSAHDAGFVSRREKIIEKLQLFLNSETIFYCLDHQAIDEAVQALGKRTFSWSREGKNADLKIKTVDINKDGSSMLHASYLEKVLDLKLPFTDDASIENAIHCWCVLLYLGVPQSDIQSRIATLQALEMRLELKEGINNCILINDSYNADLNALTIALNYLEQRAGNIPRTVILSDILQSGLSDDELYENIARQLTNKNIKKLIAVGSHIRSLQQYLPSDIEAYYFANTNGLLEYWQELSFYQEVILLKGARTFGFERLAARLAYQEHRTTLEVDLNAMLQNLLAYKNLLHPTTKVMAVVKAAAYGSGSVEVAKHLEANGIDYLAVAYTDEGVELRKAGIKTPILVLNPEETSFDLLIRYQLEPEIYSFSQLTNLVHFLGEAVPPYPIHLKIDTGMHRLGFDIQELNDVIQRLRQLPQVRVASIFSHLAASESNKHKAFSLRQIEEYQSAYQHISSKLGYFPIRHILNSAGIVRYTHHQMDMVRLGLGLFGIDASGSLQDQLQPVLQLKAHISQIKTLEAGDTIGYGRTGKAMAPMRIAVLSIGYADGLLRSTGNGAYQVLIRNQKVPTIGNICMDMCMVDISQLPEAREGDEVLIFGEGLPVEALANAMQTITHEVLTNISPRVRRVYIRS